MRFSHDGRFLMASGKFWHAGTWEEVPKKSQGTVQDLSYDGNQVASQLQSGVICLSHALSGDAYARIEGTEPRFIPHSNSLLMRTEKGIAICDLTAIERGVNELGLPWNGPTARKNLQSQPIQTITFAPELNGISTAEELYELMDRRALDRIASDPDNGQWAFDAGIAAIEQRDYTTALKHLSRACVLLPNAVTARMWRAYLLAEMERWDEAIQDADWIMAQITEPEVRLLRAEWNYRCQRIAQAIEDCSQVVTEQPKLAVRALGLRSVCHRAIGNTDAADADRKTFDEKCTAPMSQLDMAAYPMVGTDISLRHPVIANLYAEKMLALNVEIDPEYRNTIGLVLYRNGKFSDAIGMLAKNLETNRELYYASAAHVTALCHAKLGDRPEAERYMQLATNWDPADEEFNYLDQREANLLRAEAQVHLPSNDSELRIDSTNR